MKRKILTFIFNRIYRRWPPEMVKWWMTADKVQAKVVTLEDGSYGMWMEGEKYPFPGFPRGSLLYGPLSPLKHNIKNKIFNDSWKKLEDGVPENTVVADAKGKVLDEILQIGASCRYDMIPPEKMCPSVREIWRAWTKVVKNHPKEDKLLRLREILCFILQEDDAYRFRVQWLVNFFNPNAWWRRVFKRDALKDLTFALEMLENAEVLGDMKERVALLRRILTLVLKETRPLFDSFVREVDWKKLKLTKADKYFFRAKYFKVDYDKYDY